MLVGKVSKADEKTLSGRTTEIAFRLCALGVCQKSGGNSEIKNS